MRERAQGRNLYRFRTKLDFIPSLSFFHKGKLTVRLSSRIYSHKCHRKRFYSIKRKLSGVISCPELDECTLYTLREVIFARRNFREFVFQIFFFISREEIFTNQLFRDFSRELIFANENIQLFWGF